MYVIFFFGHAQGMWKCPARDQTCSTAVTQAGAMTKPDSFFFFFLSFFVVVVVVVVVVAISWAAPAAYGGSQARSLIGAVAPGLYHSHSYARSEPHLPPTPQLMATPDP